MLNVKVCLLVSDDLDVYQLLSEAVQEVSPETLLLMTGHSRHIVDFLQAKKAEINYLIIDSTIESEAESGLVKFVSSNSPLQIPIVVYSNSVFHEDIRTEGSIHYIRNDFRYSEMCKVLKKILT
jgi:hypothetical protein